MNPEKCEWTEWFQVPYRFPGARSDGTKTTTCIGLKCIGDGLSPENGIGKKYRKLKSIFQNRGVVCIGNEQDICTQPCPGKIGEIVNLGNGFYS